MKELNAEIVYTMTKSGSAAMRLWFDPNVNRWVMESGRQQMNLDNRAAMIVVADAKNDGYLITEDRA